jgi:CubicO group peptidase (beta-lactamase class C family)
VTGAALLSDPRLAADDPGCAISVVSHGHTVLTRGHGLADVDSGSAIGPRTNFRLGSASKQFAAMAVMLLVQDGRLTYSTTLADVLPAPAMALQLASDHLQPSTDSAAR